MLPLKIAWYNIKKNESDNIFECKKFSEKEEKNNSEKSFLNYLQKIAESIERYFRRVYIDDGNNGQDIPIEICKFNVETIKKPIDELRKVFYFFIIDEGITNYKNNFYYFIYQLKAAHMDYLILDVGNVFIENEDLKIVYNPMKVIEILSYFYGRFLMDLNHYKEN